MMQKRVGFILFFLSLLLMGGVPGFSFASKSVPPPESAPLSEEDEEQKAIVAEALAFARNSLSEDSATDIAENKEIFDFCRNQKELDKIIHSEKYRKIEQLKHNEKELYSFSPSVENRDGFRVTLQNQDIYKGVLLLIELAIEWQLYKKVQVFFVRRLCAKMIAHRKIFIEALEQFGTCLEGNDEDAVVEAYKKVEEQCQQIHAFGFKNLTEKEMVSALIPYAGYAQIVESIQRYYFLNHCSSRRFFLNTPLQGVANFLASDAWAGVQKNKNDKTVSAFDFMLQQANTPALFSLLGGGYLAMVNDFLEEQGYLPGWSNNLKFFIARQVIFAALFVRWSVYKFYYPLMLKCAFGDREKLIKILREYDQQTTNTDRKKKETELYDFFESEYSNAFPSWLAAKSLHYGLWRTGLNVTSMIPSIIGYIRGIYPFIKLFFHW